MKKLCLLIPLITGLLFSFMSFSQSSSFYTAAKSGLSLRENPAIDAKVIDKIPYGTKITLLTTDEEKKTIVTEGMEGSWEKVKYNNKTGYVINSYLFPLPPPKLATVKEMKNYLAQVTTAFGARLVTKSGATDNSEGFGWELRKQLYKNGAEHHEFMGYEYNSNTYFLPDFSLEQGFLLLRLIPEFKELFGEKDEFPSSSKKYVKGETEYEVTVYKRVFDADHSWIDKIRIEYAEGAVYFFEMYLLDNQLVIFYSAGL